MAEGHFVTGPTVPYAAIGGGRYFVRPARGSGVKRLYHKAARCLTRSARRLMNPGMQAYFPGLGIGVIAVPAHPPAHGGDFP